jgi:hypothetical protein
MNKRTFTDTAPASYCLLRRIDSHRLWTRIPRCTTPNWVPIYTPVSQRAVERLPQRQFN